ncbi:MAG: class 1 isoprenoid biosynthesis enzyme [Magnetococcales bacterium]|nr:class 1 isoprenoid biosynthesis enzyme [Magnetococcales bacterium]
MSLLDAETLLPQKTLEQAQRHLHEFGSVLKGLRREVKQAYRQEVFRLRQDFASTPLYAQSEPLMDILEDYLLWMEWCSWCSLHLAPPLGLTATPDARRMAAAMIIYCGPRLLDDAIDNHRNYKGLHATALDGLLRLFPDQPREMVHSQLCLLGNWLILQGIVRLTRHSSPANALATLRLCQTIAPGAILEGLHTRPLNWAEYEEIVRLKSVRYDQILYRNLLEPVAVSEKEKLLNVAAYMSTLAQYLNDFKDQQEDRCQGRDNLSTWFPGDAAFRVLCHNPIQSCLEAIESLPETTGDAFAAALVETIDAAARIHNPTPTADHVKPIAGESHEL